MIRAGHGFALARAIVELAPGDDDGCRRASPSAARTAMSKVGLPTQSAMLWSVRGTASSQWPMRRGRGRDSRSTNSIRRRRTAAGHGPGEMVRRDARLRLPRQRRGRRRILLHFSVLREHGRSSVPEGADDRMHPGAARARAAGQADRVDRSQPALPQQPRSSIPPPSGPTARRLRKRRASSSRWRSNGSTAFGDMASSSVRTEVGEDVFVHMETVRSAQLRSWSRASSWKRGSRRAARA